MIMVISLFGKPRNPSQTFLYSFSGRVIACAKVYDQRRGGLLFRDILVQALLDVVNHPGDELLEEALHEFGGNGNFLVVWLWVLVVVGDAAVGYQTEGQGLHVAVPGCDDLVHG